MLDRHLKYKHPSIKADESADKKEIMIEKEEVEKEKKIWISLKFIMANILYDANFTNFINIDL